MNSKQHFLYAVHSPVKGTSSLFPETMGDSASNCSPYQWGVKKTPSLHHHVSLPWAT